jgi:tetratricopeptide (TPR) repeat protein
MIDRASPAPAMKLHERVCTAVRAARSASPDADFLLRRAEVEVTRGSGPLAASLAHVLHRLRDRETEPAVWEDSVAWALVLSGGAIEQAGDHVAARSIFELAAEFRPTCAATVLHAGRAARRAGEAEVATRHYRQAQALDEDGRIARLARIGEAMVSGDGERRLSKEIRRAVRSGDPEAAAMGLEARALVRCEANRCEGAIRDLCVCALRYPDREDQARAAERVADLLVDAHDLEAAREALLLVHEIGTPAQRAHAEARLHQLSGALGDVLGLRRWGRPGARPKPMAPPPPTEPGAVRRRSLPMVREWRNAVQGSADGS